jgi:hypothetical protein
VFPRGKPGKAASGNLVWFLRGLIRTFSRVWMEVVMAVCLDGKGFRGRFRVRRGLEVGISLVAMAASNDQDVRLEFYLSLLQ